MRTIIDQGATRFLATLAAGAGCLALALQPMAPASPAPSGAQEPQEEDGEEEHSPLHESMETLQGGMRALRKSMTKPDQKEQALELCHDMQMATLVGFQNPPDPLEPLEGTALVEHSADFRRRMLEVCGALVELELAIEKEDGDAAKTVYRKLGKYKSDGHDLFIE